MIEKIKLLPRKFRGATSRLTFVRLREVLDYNPETGIFTWKYRAGLRNPSWNSRFAGKVAGKVVGGGYARVMIDYIDYKPSRLAWLYMTGKWPDKEIDHKDLDKTNNRWANLPLRLKQGGLLCS